jgi:hypothetical protein
MLPDEMHLTTEELLLAADGELPETRAAHLAECSQCSLVLREREESTAEVVRLHQRTLDPWVPAATAARGRLVTRLHALSGRVRTQTLAWRYAAVAACVVAAAALVYFDVIPLRGMHTVPVSFPEPSLTPGAVVAINADQVCRTPRPKNRIVPVSLQRKVFEEYGIAAAEPRAYEVDYLITPALGGSDDIRNLWPQSNSSAMWNSRIKDALEDRLHDLVCDGTLDLATAQHDLAADWIAAYRKYFHTDAPLDAPLDEAR